MCVVGDIENAEAIMCGTKNTDHANVGDVNNQPFGCTTIHIVKTCCGIDPCHERTTVSKDIHVWCLHVFCYGRNSVVRLTQCNDCVFLSAVDTVVNEHNRRLLELLYS